MGDWLGKDRWGRRLAFTQVRYDHAIDRGHFPSSKGTWQTVMTALAESTIVLDNEPLEGSVYGSERVSHERYISVVGSTVFIFPVVVSQEPVVIAGATQNPPIRLAWSAYTDVEIPDGKVLSRWPPDES